MNYRLGIDLGTDSLGWSILELDSHKEPINIIDAGVHIFSNGRNERGESLAVERRTARSMRRRRQRFIRRKHKLINYLIKMGLLPSDKQEAKKLENPKRQAHYPYLLRHEAVHRQLKPYELGRVFIHLNQRRGFKSSLKTKEVELREKTEIKITGVHYKPETKLNDFYDIWFKEKVVLRQSKSTQRNHSTDYKNHIKPFVGHYSIAAINHREANKIILNMQQKKLSNRTINKVVMVLKTILNDAVRWNYIPRSPLFGFQDLKENPRCFNYWTETEIKQFLRTNINTPEYPLYVTVLNTGLRLGEILGLCWDRINFEQDQIEVTREMTRNNILVETTKTHRKRSVPLNNVVKGVLWNLFKQQKSLSYVFVNNKGNPHSYNHFTEKQFHKAQKQAGFDKVIRFHDLRHTFASHFVMRGGSIYDLQKILGHSKIEMSSKYAHLSNDYLKSASNIVCFSGSCIVENSKVQKFENNNIKLGVFL